MNDYNFTGFTEVKPLVDLKIIKETLARIGICNKKQKILYPTCYLVQNFDEFYIAHFKELFLILREDGYNNISAEDIERKNAIIFNLQNWNLVEVVNEEEIKEHTKYVFVLPHSEKRDWRIYHKFNTQNVEILK